MSGLGTGTRRDAFFDAQQFPEQREDVVLHLLERKSCLVQLVLQRQHRHAFEAVVDVESSLDDDAELLAVEGSEGGD